VAHTIIREWRKKQFIEELKDELVPRMAQVGEFVRDQAAARALKLTGLTKADFEFEVKVYPLMVETRVGIPQGKGHAFYWWYHEVGTRKGLPPRPALRPAVFDNKAAIVRIVLYG
jgi:hypothetical protein